MATFIEPTSAAMPAVSERRSFFASYFTRLSLDSPAPWDTVTVGALFSLTVLWGFWMHYTWAAWGNLTIDSGHEMFVPAMLAQGKSLYRDVWFMYPPAGPYFNSYLFRLFGARLDVLYWAGSLSALGSAIFLYLAGMRLSSWLAGWAAGTAVILQSFQPSLFCFPLPYSFSPVYGCLMACLFIWLMVRAVDSESRIWLLAAGMAAAAALLLKLEYGTACYGLLGLFLAVRGVRRRSWSSFAKDLATTLPGMAACAWVGYWMVSLAGVKFITQENFMSWPTAYFMQKYGKMWLASTGFTFTIPALHDAMVRGFLPASILLALCCMFVWKAPDNRSKILSRVLCLCVVAYLAFSPIVRAYGALSLLFFPRDMVLYVSAAALFAWWYCWRYSLSQRSLAIPLLFTFVALLAFRILCNTEPQGYPIYYDGPAILSFLLLLRAGIPSFLRSKRLIFAAEAAICLACVSVPAAQARNAEKALAYYAPLTTDRGTVRAPQPLVEGYRIAIQFMKDKAAAGQSVMSVPEDTSLYFFSGTTPPTRYYLFTPGVIVPGTMTEKLLRDIEHKPPRYLLWSNRIFPEYGAPVFGKDFDVPLGNYLRTHYRRVGPLTPYSKSTFDWHADLWELKTENQ